MAIWSAVILVAFLYGLSGGEAQWELIGAMLTGGGDAEGAGMILFLLMGFWPAAFFLLWFPMRHRFRPGPLPFVVLSFAAGAFALIPYLILRVPTGENPSGAGSSPAEYRRRSVGLKAAALILLGLTIAAMLPFIGKVDLERFGRTWLEFPFYQVMSIDFLYRCCIGPPQLQFPKG